MPFNWGWVPGPLRSLGWTTLDAYRFHVGLQSPHAYQSNPWSWLVLGRPVDFYYDSSSTSCGASSCAREVLLIGTPLMWWAFIPMLLWLAWHWLTTRDWRAGAVWVAFLAGWLVWFQHLNRTMFLFYMAPLVPFLVIGLTLALGTMLGPALPTRSRYHDRTASHDPTASDDRTTSEEPTASEDPAAVEAAADPEEQDRRRLRRRYWGLAGMCGFLALVVVDFAWMWPIFTGGLLTYDQWHAHMWLPSWV